MKTKLPWMVVAAVLLAACNEKKEAAAAESKLPAKRFSPAALASQPHNPPAPEAEPEPAPEAPPVAQQTPPPAPTPVAPATPKPAPAPTLSAAEREAQRAEQRQQRIARASEQITTRLKEQDANHDGFLTQNELSGPMQRGFTRADTNKDGSLDATEQQAMVQSFAERMGNDRGGNDRRGSSRRGQGGFGGGYGGFGGRGRDD